MKKVVVIGGGSGQSIMLRAIKRMGDIDLKTIVTVADDGGSTGRLREIFNIPAVGDIRSVMCALSNDEEVIEYLMNFRFDRDSEEFSNHNLGNLIMCALIKRNHNLYDSIYEMGRLLNIKGEVIPSTLETITLHAYMDDGVHVRGEHNITGAKSKVSRVFHEDDVEANPLAINAIIDADYIIYSIGSLYTSIMPSLIIPKIKNALQKSKAKKIYFCNAMSEEGETLNYSLEDHVQAIEDHTGLLVDIAVCHNDIIPQEILAKYQLENAHEIKSVENNHHYDIIRSELLTFDKNRIRHDGNKIIKVLERLLK
ncbi:MAG: gluconeogenesis factor YvcK family protein [Erysipelotrichaceae bacterium]